jgi:hypothetical protein
MVHLSNKNSIALWAGLVQVNNFPNNIRRLAHSSHEDCRCVAPPCSRVTCPCWSRDRHQDRRIAASPSWNFRWPRTHCTMHNVAVGIQRRLRTTMPPGAFSAEVDSICAALTAHSRDSLTKKPRPGAAIPRDSVPSVGYPATTTTWATSQAPVHGA